MNVLVVAGARPNFMKVAPIMAELRRREHEVALVHTGQHYDPSMSSAFFEDLSMPAPDYHLEVGSGSHAEQTARVMERFDPVLAAVEPDWVVVVGDVNSTMAAAIVTAKRRATSPVRLAHVEAGLRSGDWAMPEEVNRVITDQISDLLLIHSPEATGHLLREGVPSERIVFVGNVMMDALFDVRGRHAGDAPWEALGLTRQAYGLVTLHRPSNVDDPSIMAALLHALDRLSHDLPLVWPMHPRAKHAIARDGHTLPAGLQLIEPVGYRAMTAWLDGAKVVVTDSGGLQEESTALGVPCVTVRASTERPITVLEGTNRMVAWPPTAEGVHDAVDAAIGVGRSAGSRALSKPAGWDGHTAARIVDALEHSPASLLARVQPASSG